MNEEPLLSFEKSVPGRVGVDLPPCDVPEEPLEELLPSALLRTTPPRLPELSEPDVVRHFTALAHRNWSVDQGFYPLGSCTMKYNPRRNETLAALPGFAQLHPLTPPELSQGTLALLHRLQGYLCELTGMDAFTLAPAAGAHGELTGLMLIRAYHRAKGNRKSKVIVPDSAHGTNPASAAICGYQVVEVRSNAQGGIDLEHLASVLDDEVAALMLTNPNTLGVFDPHILTIAEMFHRHDALLYYDGANLNAIVGRCRPGDMGFDVVHLNLHKTFSTPHGGGGPGAGPVGVKAPLKPFLPPPLVAFDGERYFLTEAGPSSIGPLMAFLGNVGVLLRAYCYIRTLGLEGLRAVSEHAVLSANYLMARLRGTYPVPYSQNVMHEFVLSTRPFREQGLRAMDFAKRLMDYGFHPPTVAFPLIVEDALMIEPTETEGLETLDAFAQALLAIAEEARSNPSLLREAPHAAPIRRPDEAKAARQPVVRWFPPAP